MLPKQLQPYPSEVVHVDPNDVIWQHLSARRACRHVSHQYVGVSQAPFNAYIKLIKIPSHFYLETFYNSDNARKTCFNYYI